MAFKDKKEIDALLLEYDYVPTAEAKRLPRWQMHQVSQRNIAIGSPGKLVIETLPPNPPLVIPEGLPWELAWYYEAAMNEQTGISGYAALIEKIPKKKAAKE